MLATVPLIIPTHDELTVLQGPFRVQVKHCHNVAAPIHELQSKTAKRLLCLQLADQSSECTAILYQPFANNISPGATLLIRDVKACSGFLLLDPTSTVIETASVETAREEDARDKGSHELRWEMPTMTDHTDRAPQFTPVGQRYAIAVT